MQLSGLTQRKRVSELVAFSCLALSGDRGYVRFGIREGNVCRSLGKIRSRSSCLHRRRQYDRMGSFTRDRIRDA